MYLRTIQLLIVFFLISLNLFAQRDYEEGYIVTPTNDTLFGKIRDRETGAFPRILKKIRFKEDNSRFRKKYTASQIMGYKTGNRVYESIGIKPESIFFRTRYLLTDTYKKEFVRVMHKGKLNYYHWEYADSESNTLEYFPLFHIEGRAEMVRATQGLLGLKKKALSEYFSGCPALVQRINEREIRTPEDVIEFFGKNCGDGD
jgi:hypothetical protein